MAKEVNTSLPYNLEAEQSLLGSIMIDQELQFEISSRLKAEDFYLESHRLVFEGMSSILQENKSVDINEIRENLRIRDDLDLNGGNFVEPNDAIRIDTSNLSLDEIYDFMMEKITEKINKS